MFFLNWALFDVKHKLLEHAMTIVARVVERRNRELINVDEIRFYFIPVRGITAALFVVRGIPKEYRDKERVKKGMCYVDIKNRFDRVSKR